MLIQAVQHLGRPAGTARGDRPGYLGQAPGRPVRRRREPSWDSPSELRTRDSLGNDVVTGPGGMVWTQAGNGLVHEEMAAKPDGVMHMVQLFVNLPRGGKLAPPRVFRLERDKAPEWHSSAGDRVRVLVGSFEGENSPLTPAQPFRFLDVRLRNEISFGLQEGHNALVYVLSGAVAISAEGEEEWLAAEHAVGMRGDGASVMLKAGEDAHLLVLSAAEIREPIVSWGPFIMNDQAQIDDAIARYRAGRMGQLAPGDGEATTSCLLTARGLSSDSPRSR